VAEKFDAIILGMGPGGENVAGRLLKAGKNVAVVERELLGGECAYWACIPSKTLLRPPELKGEATRAFGTGTPHISTERNTGSWTPRTSSSVPIGSSDLTRPCVQPMHTKYTTDVRRNSTQGNDAGFELFEPHAHTPTQRQSASRAFQATHRVSSSPS
jgi:choline dehydrogenase-like flavoprotein